MSIYHKIGDRPFVIGCGVFGGRSKKTGKPVGERHRWPNGWGKGRCEFCGRYLDEVLSKLEPQSRADMPLTAVIERCVDKDADGAKEDQRG